MGPRPRLSVRQQGALAPQLPRATESPEFQPGICALLGVLGVAQAI